MSYVPGEANIVLTIPAPQGTIEDTLIAAQRIDCVAMVNTDTLIQAHFPGYLRNRETWMERPGWNGEYYRHLPDLRLRCLLVLARYAAGWTDSIRSVDVEAIPVDHSTDVLEAELLAHLRTLFDSQPMNWDYDPDRAGPTEDMQPPWETVPARGLRLLYEGLIRLSGAKRPSSLAKFPGRISFPCVKGRFVQWNSVHVFFVMPVSRGDSGEIHDEDHWMTTAIKNWLIYNRKTTSHEPSGPEKCAELFDFRRYRRTARETRPRHARTGWIHFLQNPSQFLPWSLQMQQQIEREASGSWAGCDPCESRSEYGLRERRMEIIDLWQKWEGSGNTYIWIPGYGRFFLWGRRGPNYPSVITPKNIEKLKHDLDRPGSGVAGAMGRGLAIARFRYGIPDMDWGELTSGTFRQRQRDSQKKE